MGVACRTNWENRNAYMLFVGETEGKRPLGRSKRRWVNNSRVDLREIKWGGMYQIGLAQDMDRCRALLNAATNPQVQ
jgi:hypothetical protein